MALSRPEFDIAIIGAGPAGSSAAITAARFGARVVLFEAGEFPRHKVCGEFVSAESLDILRDLLQSVSDADRILQAAPVIDRMRLLLDQEMVAARLTPPALSITRFDLDQLLWLAAERLGVQTKSSCEVRAIHGEGPFRLDTLSGPIETSAVIVAAGRWSRLTPRTSIPDGPKWIGVKAHYRELNPPRSTDLYFFNHGYCGVQPVSDHVVNACAMVRSDRATSLEELFALHPALADRRRCWQPIMAPVSTAPLIYRTPQPATGNLICVGDAAAFIDPFVGDGISLALRTGQFAAKELQSFVVGSAKLHATVASYGNWYQEHIVPLVNAASRIRTLLSWPRPAQLAALELMRVPGVMSYIIRRTRRSC